MNKKILILKDNYNTLEKFYNNELKKIGIQCDFYYKSSSIIRKLMTHNGLVGESLWYGIWKKKVQEFDLIIVFDSIHTSKMLSYLSKKSNARLVYWHWNPINSSEALKIYKQTKNICEHWTFNPLDAKKYQMHLNNQFFFYQDITNIEKTNTAFFVGTNKGRYETLLSLAELLKKYGYNPDFHIVDKEIQGSYLQKSYMEYEDVLLSIQTSKLIVEIVQEGQDGLTIRALEAMFFESKLLTNNKKIVNYSFYNKNNIFIMGVDEIGNLEAFLNTPFEILKKDDLYDFSAQGWLENFG